ncbi:MAG TPA: ATP-binding protein [Streptosporangiaceae bacterium]|nr:ATP-binding protein [Streptosporangiaceae bacterium]
MLLRFRAANVLSIRDEQTLTFVATELNDGSARGTSIREDGKSVSVVPVVGIFGANASGKTKVLDALIMMRTAVLRSVIWFSEQEPVRRIPFLLDPDTIRDPSFFEVDAEIHGTRYTYGFELDDTRVRGEWLHAYPRGRRQVWFDRDDGGEVTFPGEGLRGDKLDLARRTRHDSLFLTVAATLNHEQLTPVFEWFRDMLRLITHERPDRRQRLLWAKREAIRDPEFRLRVAGLLKKADLGIVGIEVVRALESEIQFTHRAQGDDKPLDFNSESHGTQSWFALAAALLKALEDGALVLVDELDASLHPTVCAEAVRMFESPESNPRGAQMLFTTHDVTLLRTLTGGGRVLDRDSIWLTEKGDSGATSLYPLNGFRPAPRRDDNLERRYLLGAYGGRPRIQPGALSREVKEALA